MPLFPYLGHFRIFKYLFSIVKNPNAPNGAGETPIHLSAGWGHHEIVKFLASKLENPNAPNANGETTIDIAAEQGHIEIVKFLSSEMNKKLQMLQLKLEENHTK